MTQLSVADSGDVLTLSEAAGFLRVSEKTVADLARREAIPARKVGREWRFARGALVEWLGRRTDAPRQLSLDAQVPGAHKSSECVFGADGFKDTAFTSNREEPVHRWVPWIAGFSSEFVRHALGPASDCETVLDPFAGVGTTLVEAMRLGYNVTGFEVNAYASLACRAKLRIAEYDPDEIEGLLGDFVDFVGSRTASGDTPESRPPAGFVSRTAFFSPAIERQVLFALDFIERMDCEVGADLFRLALGAVMVSFSNYSYEPSLGTRAAAGKPGIEEADVTAIVGRRLSQMVVDIRQWHTEQAGRRVPAGELHRASCLSAPDLVAPQSVDAIVTSPPYLNNYHYVRNTRPHLYWLGLADARAELAELEEISFGKFWQNVRSGPPVGLREDVPGLAEQLDELSRRNPAKGVYGGSGWANYAATYFNDCGVLCRAMARWLVPGGRAIVVIGNNILQGLEFKTDQILADIGQSAGLRVQGIHEVRTKRTGSSILNSSVRMGETPVKTRLYESAVVFAAP